MWLEDPDREVPGEILAEHERILAALECRNADRRAAPAEAPPRAVGDLPANARQSAGKRLSGERSPTDQRCPNGSTKPPWRWVPHGT
jgi:hypothetical protein